MYVAKEVGELVKWLEPIQYNHKHEASSALRQDGTCIWLLEHEAYVRWLTERGFLWLNGIRTYDLIFISMIQHLIHGTAGSGKTILA